MNDFLDRLCFNIKSMNVIFEAFEKLWNLREKAEWK